MPNFPVSDTCLQSPRSTCKTNTHTHTHTHTHRTFTLMTSPSKRGITGARSDAHAVGETLLCCTHPVDDLRCCKGDRKLHSRGLVGRSDFESAEDGRSRMSWCTLFLTLRREARSRGRKIRKAAGRRDEPVGPVPHGPERSVLLPTVDQALVPWSYNLLRPFLLVTMLFSD